MQRPQTINITAALMSLSLFTDTVLIFINAKPGVAHLWGYEIPLLIQCLAGMFVWFYWKGQNWARWFVMIQSVICLLTVLGVRKKYAESHAEAGVFIFDAILAVFLLIYLNTRHARQWFTSAAKG